MPDNEQQVKDIEEEIRKTPYNKATQHHIGLLKAKLARLRTRAGATRGKGEGYHVRKAGDGTVVLLGFPSTGKSTLLNALCRTESETGAYAFTTLKIVPGTLVHRHARIQILDVPGIVEGAAAGRGRGKEVLACLRSADLVLIVGDVTRPDDVAVVRKEAYNAGVRLNELRPDVRITKTGTGGVRLLSTVKLSHLDTRIVRAVLKEFKTPNADVVLREDITVEQLIDCVEDNKQYVPGIAVLNKRDLVSASRLRAVTKSYAPDLVVSAQTGDGVPELRNLIWERLGLMSVFLKEPGKEADLDEPLVMFAGATVKDLCGKLHKDFTGKFRFCRVWGPSAKFDGQKLMLRHRLREGDVVEIHLR